MTRNRGQWAKSWFFLHKTSFLYCCILHGDYCFRYFSSSTSAFSKERCSAMVSSSSLIIYRVLQCRSSFAKILGYPKITKRKIDGIDSLSWALRWHLQSYHYQRQQYFSTLNTINSVESLSGAIEQNKKDDNTNNNDKNDNDNDNDNDNYAANPNNKFPSSKTPAIEENNKRRRIADVSLFSHQDDK